MWSKINKINIAINYKKINWKNINTDLMNKLCKNHSFLIKYSI